MTAFMPLSCWNNISPIDISSGFEYIFENKLRYPGISSFLPMWLAFSISLNSCVTSAFFPLNHCNAFFAFLFLSTNHTTMKITTTVQGIWRRGKTKIYYAFAQNLLLLMYHCGVSGMRNMHTKNGIGIQAPRMASICQLRYFPAMKHNRIPLLPRVVGKRPNVPLTWGCTVSPKYTGRPNEAIPTQNPAMARPAITIWTFTAIAIRTKAVKKTNTKQLLYVYGFVY